MRSNFPSKLCYKYRQEQRDMHGEQPTSYISDIEEQQTYEKHKDAAEGLLMFWRDCQIREKAEGVKLEDILTYVMENRKPVEEIVIVEKEKPKKRRAAATATAKRVKETEYPVIKKKIKKNKKSTKKTTGTKQKKKTVKIATLKTNKAAAKNKKKAEDEKMEDKVQDNTNRKDNAIALSEINIEPVIENKKEADSKTKATLASTKFLEKEDKFIIIMQNIFGNKWTMISTFLEGRTENNVKNRWYSKLKKTTVFGCSGIELGCSCEVCDVIKHCKDSRLTVEEAVKNIKEKINIE